MSTFFYFALTCAPEFASASNKEGRGGFDNNFGLSLDLNFGSCVKHCRSAVSCNTMALQCSRFATGITANDVGTWFDAVNVLVIVSFALERVSTIDDKLSLAFNSDFATFFHFGFNMIADICLC
jgi:hypothetical protein